MKLTPSRREALQLVADNDGNVRAWGNVYGAQFLTFTIEAEPWDEHIPGKLSPAFRWLKDNGLIASSMPARLAAPRRLSITDAGRAALAEDGAA